MGAEPTAVPARVQPSTHDVLAAMQACGLARTMLQVHDWDALLDQFRREDALGWMLTPRRTQFRQQRAEAAAELFKAAQLLIGAVAHYEAVHVREAGQEKAFANLVHGPGVDRLEN